MGYHSKQIATRFVMSDFDYYDLEDQVALVAKPGI